ncbi:MAG TPA: hypothetical protein VFJ95_16530 [Gammaproteobacteria bacterium]|jgi:hypothetical protein|nr:hypothetical protein [Gammaproteobacteria bacterium]
MDVRVVCALPPLSYPEHDYVRVHTCTDPADDTVTLATIERIVDKINVTAEAPARKRVKTLLTRQPMSADDALGLATRYAERKKISVVFADRS